MATSQLVQDCLDNLQKVAVDPGIALDRLHLEALVLDICSKSWPFACRHTYS